MQKDIIELLVVILIALVPGILATIWYFKVSTKQYLAHPNIKLALGLCNSIAVLLLILYIAVQQDNGLMSIGFDLTKAADILCGSALFLPVSLVIIAVSKLCGIKKKETGELPKHVQLALTYTTKWQRCLYCVSSILGSTEEELVFRGYLILLWSQRSNATAVFVIVSGILFVAGHLYQGSVRRHFFSAILLTIPTLITGNVMISIGLHITWDIIYISSLWNKNASPKLDGGQSHKYTKSSVFIALYLVFSIVYILLKIVEIFLI